MTWTAIYSVDQQLTAVPHHLLLSTPWWSLPTVKGRQAQTVSCPLASTRIAGIGYLLVEDVKTVLHALGLCLSHRTVRELTSAVADARRPERIYYASLAESEVADNA